MNIYVASSWRNAMQPQVVRALREAGHEVYDFRQPDERGVEGGFSWREIDPDWQSWSPAKFRELVHHPIASVGFYRDFEAMQKADACVLVMPCGRSAHLELGWCAGARKRTLILLTHGEPELMYRIADRLCLSIAEVIDALGRG